MVENNFISIEDILKDLENQCEIKAIKDECEEWGIIC